MCITAGSSGYQVRVNSPWAQSASTDNEWGVSSLFAYVLPTDILGNWNVAQSNTNMLLSGMSAPQMTSSMQTLMSTLSGNIVVQCALTVNAGDIVRLSAQTLYEQGRLNITGGLLLIIY